MANDLASLVPSAVNIVFQATGASIPASGYYSIKVTLASLKLTQYLNITGAPWTKVLHRYEAATFPSAGAPSNLTALTSLANQLVTDWYLWQLARLDQQFSGYLGWTSEGMHDIEWRQWHRRATTRVIRGPVNPLEDLLYTFGGSVVNFSNPTTWNFNSPTTWNVNAPWTLTGAGPFNIDVTTVDINALTVNIGNYGVWVYDGTTNVTFNGITRICGDWVINKDAQLTLVANQPAANCPLKPIKPVSFGGFNLQGIIAPNLGLGLYDALHIVLWCNGTAGYVTHEDVAAVAANRFHLAGGQNLQMATDDIAAFAYDLAISRWRLIWTTAKVLRTVQYDSLAGDTNDLPLNVGAEWLEINPTVPINLTGITGNNLQDRFVFLQNVGANNLTLKHQNAGSAGANQFFTSTTGDITILPNHSVYIGYDGVAWRDLNSSPLAGKGDLWAYSTTNARLPVGTDGQLLTADSTQPIGLRWSSDFTFIGVTKLCGTWVINEAPLATLVADTPALPCPPKPWQPIDFANFKLQGMVKPAVGLNLAAVDLMRVILVSNGSFGGYITHEDAAAVAANRFNIPGGLTLQMAYGDTATCDYDQGLSRWRVVETTGKLLRPIQATNIFANTNDLTLDIGTEWLELNCAPANNLTGLANGIVDRRIVITNVGTGILTLKHNSASSLAANRFFFAGAADIALAPNASLEVGYDGTYWRDMAAPSGAASAGLDKCQQYYRQVGVAPERWYFGGDPNGVFSTASGLSFASNTLWAFPFLAARGGTLDRIAFATHSVQAPVNVRIGIYTNTSDTNLTPNALVVDSGTVNCGGSVGNQATTINVTLTAGALYWLVIVCDTSNPDLMNTSLAQCWPILGYGVPSGVSAGAGYGWSAALAFGALPGTFPAAAPLGAPNAIPIIAVRFSA